MQMTLRNVAHVRSGDKGNTACISVIAFSPELYAVLHEQLSAEQFKSFYKGVITGTVTRYEARGWTRCNSLPTVRWAAGSRAACVSTIMGKHYVPRSWLTRSRCPNGCKIRCEGNSRRQ